MHGHVVERTISFYISCNAGEIVYTSCAHFGIYFRHGIKNIVGVIFRLASLWEIRSIRGSRGQHQSTGGQCGQNEVHISAPLRNSLSRHPPDDRPADIAPQGEPRQGGRALAMSACPLVIAAPDGAHWSLLRKRSRRALGGAGPSRAKLRWRTGDPGAKEAQRAGVVQPRRSARTPHRHYEGSRRSTAQIRRWPANVRFVHGPALQGLPWPELRCWKACRLTGRRQPRNLGRTGRGLGGSRCHRPNGGALRTFLAAAFMIMFMGKAHAMFLDGNTLRGWCFSEDAGNQAACLGYVIAVADVLISEDRDELTQYKAWIPTIEATQAVDTTKQYLDTHRQAGDITASDLVAMALSEAFPCPS